MIKIDNSSIKMIGHVQVFDVTDVLQNPEFDDTGAICNGTTIRDDYNAIHPENMSLAIAQAMSGVVDNSGKNYGTISEMRFGNGGTVILGNSRVLYKKPKTTSIGGLYSETYTKNINSNIDTGVDSAFNYVNPYHIPGQIFSDIVCVCTLGLGEPSDQSASSSNSLSGKYVFDELSLYSAAGSPLTHIVFYPVEKAANKVLQIKYTIRIQMV
jgi:hypothetical protein